MNENNPKSRITFDVDLNFKRKVKVAAAKNDLTISDFSRKALEVALELNNYDEMIKIADSRLNEINKLLEEKDNR